MLSYFNILTAVIAVSDVNIRDENKFHRGIKQSELKYVVWLMFTIGTHFMLQFHIKVMIKCPVTA